MNIDIYSEVKRAFKDALDEWNKENKKNAFTGVFVEPQETNNTFSNLLTVKQFSKKHPFITEAGLRWKLYYREYNGFDKCMSKSGGKILLKEKETIDWFSNPPDNHDWTHNKKKHATR